MNEYQLRQALAKAQEQLEFQKQQLAHLEENLRHERRLHALDCLEAGLRALHFGAGAYFVVAQSETEGIAVFKQPSLREAVALANRTLGDAMKGKWGDVVRIRVMAALWTGDVEREAPARMKRRP